MKRKEIIKLITIVSFIFLTNSLVFEVEGVDRSKFKTCSQSGFCRRNRELGEQLTEQGSARSPFVFSPFHSASSTTHSVTSMQNLAFPDVEFQTEWHTFGHSLARLQVKEKSPLHPRYAVHDVLIERFLETQASPHSATASTTSSLHFGTDGNNHEIRLDATGRYYELLINNRVVMEVNKRGFLSFEHSREKSKALASEEKKSAEEESDLEEGAEKEKLVDSLQDESKLKENIASAMQNAFGGRNDVASSSSKEGAGEWIVVNSADGGWEENFGGHSDSKPRGPQSVGLDIRFTGSKHVYGIPEHASSFSLKDTRKNKGGDYSEPYRLYNLDVFEYEVDNPMALYGSVPIMISHTAEYTVGVFWVNTAETWIDVEHTEAGVDTHWISETGNIDVFFFFGPTPAKVLHQISELTGAAALPPLFSLGYHQCRWNYKNQEDVAAVDAGFDEHLIPYDVIWLDIEHTNGKRYFTWDENHFPSPRSMQDAIALKGRKMVTIVDPHIKRDNGYHVHKQATEKGYYVKNAQGQDYEGWCWPGSSSWIDYTLPAARFWWGELFNYDVYVGSTPNLYTWNDMNEPSVFNGPEVTMHKDALHHGHVEHRELHNLVGLEFHRATSMGLIKRNSGDNERPFVLSRAFYAGTQRWGAIWTGDNAASWDHLIYSTPMILSIGIVGIPFAGADVGGFFGNPEPDLLVRWYQVGAYQPFFRGHAHLDTKRREPWLFGEPYTTHIRDAIRSRYTLLPYWYTLFYQSSKTGAPPVRPLWFEFPQDPALFDLEDQFLVGSDVLVKPITQPDITSTSVYLPGTNPWYDIETYQAYPAGHLGSIRTPLEKIPVFQRGGSILTTWERTRRSSSQMKSDPYTLVVALNQTQGAFGEVYIDDGHSFNYQNSHFLHRTFTFTKGTLTSTSKNPIAFPLTNTIERIRILGLPKAPASVRLFSKTSLETLDFSFAEDQKVLTIRKPGILISEDFKIELK